MNFTLQRTTMRKTAFDHPDPYVFNQRWEIKLPFFDENIEEWVEYSICGTSYHESALACTDVSALANMKSVMLAAIETYLECNEYSVRQKIYCFNGPEEIDLGQVGKFVNRLDKDIKQFSLEHLDRLTQYQYIYYGTMNAVAALCTDRMTLTCREDFTPFDGIEPLIEWLKQ